MKEQQTPYRIQHVPAHHGSGRYDEHWTLDAMASGHGLTTHPTREAAQARADELFGPMPLATFTVKVYTDRTQVHAVAVKDAAPCKVLDQAIGALRAEIADLNSCPFHTPSQRLDTATVERCARAMCVADGLDPDEHIIGGQATGFEDFGPLWQAEERSEGQLGLTNYKRLATAALATEPHQHGGKGA